MNKDFQQIEKIVKLLKSIFYKNNKWEFIYNANKLTFDEIKRLYPEFSDPEYKIICLDYLGYTNNMIANAIDWEAQTVAQHKTNIREKLVAEKRDNIAPFIAEKFAAEREKKQP
jgi:DNA-binding NarL/FixJ family response regulator